MRAISVAKDFTRFPSGRLKGVTSGEAFRERFLESAIRAGESIEVDLDGTLGYSSSFLDEAFGGLVRTLGIAPDALLAVLRIKSEDSQLVEEVKSYILDAWQRKRA